MAKRTAALRILFGADTKQFDAALKQSVRKMQRTAKDLQTVGKSLSKNLTAPLLGIAAISTKTAVDFEFAMAKVQAVSGFTAAEMQRLEKQAENLGATTSRTQDEVAGLQLELAKLGKTADEIEAMTESVLSLSIAFDQDLAESARVIGATLNQFDLSAEESGRVADNMAVLFGTSALDLEKFDAAMRTVGPTANAMGLSVEEAGAAMALLVNSGVDASTVGTALTKSLTTLAKKGFEGKDALAALTSQNLSVAEAFEIFGDRAGKIVPILAESSDELQRYITLQEDGEGAALKARKTLEATAKGGFDKLRSALSAAATQIGKKFLPMVNRIVDGLTELISGFAALDTGVIASVVSIGGLVASIGPLIFIAGQMVFAYSQLTIAINSNTASQLKNIAALATNPYVLLGAAIATLAYGFYKWSTQLNATEQAQQKLLETQDKIDNQYADEAANLEVLVRQYKDSSDNLEKRRSLLDRIAKLAPEVAEGLDAETTSYDDLRTATDKYLKSLRQEIALKVYKDQLTEAIAEQTRLEQQAVKNGDKRVRAELEVEAAQQAYNDAVANGSALDEVRAKTALINAQARLADGQALYDQEQETNTALEAQKAIVDQLEQAYKDLTVSLNEVPDETDDGNGAAGKAKSINETAEARGKDLKAIEALSGELDTYLLKQLREVKQQDDLAAAIKRVEAARKGERGGIVTEGRVSINIPEDTLTLGQRLERVFTSLPEIASNTFRDIAAQAESIGNIIGNAFESAFASAAEGTETLGDALKRTGREALGIILAEVVGLAIKNAFQTASASGPGALVLGPALAGAAAGAAKSLFSSSVPAFAQGGMVTGPTLSLLGDNRSGKEAVIPFERMGEFLGKFGGGQQSVNVHGRVDGRDLILVQERGARNQTRYR